MAAAFGTHREAAICRELTKQIETVLRGGLRELHTILALDRIQQKGEFVIIVAGAEQEQSAAMADAVQLARALQEYLSLSQAARVAAKLHDVDRRALYELLSNPN